MPDHKFTPGELPPGKIMLVRKFPNGEELAMLLDVDDDDERASRSFRALVQAMEPPA